MGTRVRYCSDADERGRGRKGNEMSWPGTSSSNPLGGKACRVTELNVNAFDTTIARRLNKGLKGLFSI